MISHYLSVKWAVLTLFLISNYLYVKWAVLTPLRGGGLLF